MMATVPLVISGYKSYSEIKVFSLQNCWTVGLDYKSASLSKILSSESGVVI